MDRVALWTLFGTTSFSYLRFYLVIRLYWSQLRLIWIFSRRFSSFFNRTTDLTRYVPLFSTDVNRFTGNPAVTGSSPCFSQKLFRAFAKADETERSLFHFFSTVRLFSNFFAFKGPPSIYDVLQHTGFSKNPKVSPFIILKTLRFLSLRYSADFRRSRLVV